MTARYSMTLVPAGAVIPEDLRHLVVEGRDLLEKINKCKDNTLNLVLVNTRELQLLVEYRDLFDMSVSAIIGLAGAMYSTVWNTYVATMDRVTIDVIRQRMRESNSAGADAGNASIVAPTRADRLARLTAVPRREEQLKDEGDISDDSGAY